MSLPRIEGHVIVSSDGMIANAEGIVPPELIIDADQRTFFRSLEAADAIAHGANSREPLPATATYPRLILTRKIPALARDLHNAHALLWNPAGASFEDAWKELGVSGVLAVIGGTDVFGLFLSRYDAFHLSRAARVTLPGGRPVFPQVPAQSPEQVLRGHGLKPGVTRILDAAADATITTWEPIRRTVR
jgi:dihydrofolate reductase